MARRCDVAWHKSLSEDVQRRPRTTLDGHQSSSFFQTICDDMRLFMRQCVIFNLSRKDTPSFTFSELQVWKCNSFPNPVVKARSSQSFSLRFLGELLRFRLSARFWVLLTYQNLAGSTGCPSLSAERSADEHSSLKGPQENVLSNDIVRYLFVF